MRFKCKKCQKTFAIPARYVEIDPEFNKRVKELPEGKFLSRPAKASGYEPKMITACCPFCGSLEFEET